MKKAFLISKILLLSLSFLACEDEKQQEKIATEEIKFSKEGELYLLKPTDDTIQKVDIEISDDDYERQTGLMYRDSMKDSEGMLFIFENEKPRSFYMKNTQIPLDILYISADKTVVDIIKNAEPYNESSLPSAFPAQYVLELNAGLTDEWDIQIDDKVSFSRK